MDTNIARKTSMNRWRTSAPPVAQRGLVLFIALIVLVAMSLAAIALVRSVDTANVITGNLSYRGGAVQESDQGVEAARALVAALVVAGTDGADNLAGNNNYYASIKATNDTALVTILSGLGTAVPKDLATGNTVTYMVERMCNQPGAPSLNTCSMFVTPSQKDQKIKPGEGVGGGATPYYRVTVLVTGPRDTQTITQTMFYLI